MRPATHPSRLFLSLLLLVWLVPRGWGGVPQPSPEEPQSRAAYLNAIVARELTRIALMDYRLQPSPRADDLRILGGALAIAQDLDPTNLQRAHHLVDIAYRLGDEDALERRTREVLRLDPGDTVAALRLITLRIGRLQTIEERLGAYERYIGAERLDAAIRSRLALDAALLTREQGDEQGFVRLLTRALQLDATNKDAAALAASYFAERIPDDPAGRLELSVNVLLADPLDVHVHLSIARQLARIGAFTQAERFHALARQILQAEQGQLSEAMQLERLILAWQIQGPEVPLRELSDSLASQRYMASLELQMAQAEGMSTSGLTKPEDIRLSDALEALRILAAHAAGDQQVLGGAMLDLRTTLEKTNRLVLNPQDLPAGTTIEQVRERITRLEMLLVLLHAWTGVAMEQIVPNLPRLPQVSGENANPLLQAFAAIYTETPEKAERRFRDLLESDAAAWAGLGLSLIRQGRVDEAVQAYARLARMAPLSPEGAWARSMALQLSGVDVMRFEETEQVAEIARGVPLWVDRMVQDPSSAVQLSAEMERMQVAPLEPIRVRVRIRNLAPVALALGADRPIQSRLLIAPSIDVGIDARDLAALPEVGELERRLRLLPREELTASLDVVPGFTGWYLDTSCEASARVRARVLQGFRQVRGRLIPGAVALVDETDRIIRTVPSESTMTPDELALWIPQCGEQQLPVALLHVRRHLVGMGEELSDEQKAALVEACTQRYDRLSGEARAASLLILPTARLVPELDPFEQHAIERARDEQDRRVLAALLLTRVVSADSPLLTHERVLGDPGLGAMAGALAARLADGGTGYAHAGPTIADLARPAQGQ